MKNAHNVYIIAIWSSSFLFQHLKDNPDFSDCVYLHMFKSVIKSVQSKFSILKSGKTADNPLEYNIYVSRCIMLMFFNIVTIQLLGLRDKWFSADDILSDWTIGWFPDSFLDELRERSLLHLFLPGDATGERFAPGDGNGVASSLSTFDAVEYCGLLYKKLAELRL